MKTQLTLLAACLLIFTSCEKGVESIKDRFGSANKNVFVEHIISAGQQSSNQNGYRPFKRSELNFIVKFNSTAVYRTASAQNQSDINKLYGFSEGNQSHHVNSARIGWRWYNNQLQLLAYVYNNNVATHQVITTVAIGQEVNCTIKISGNSYQFDVSGSVVTLPRASATTQADGFMLYPFFGGDEMAPHNIHIWIKDL